MKIAIYTRSMNHQLYASAMKTLASFGYKRHRLMGTTADGYLKKILRSTADYVINIDEDAFVTDPKALTELLEYCIQHQIVNCGMPDGGVSRMRTHNPLVTNPFFNIFAVRELRKNFSEKVIQEYAVHKPEYESFTPHHLLHEGIIHTCMTTLSPTAPSSYGPVRPAKHSTWMPYNTRTDALPCCSTTRESRFWCTPGILVTTA